MSRKNVCIMAASILALTGTTVSAQSQYDSPRNSLRTAERLSQMQGSLTDAIKAAEKHTSGTAVAVRVSSNRDFNNSQSGDPRRGEWDNDTQSGNQTTNTTDRDRTTRPTNQPANQPTNQPRTPVETPPTVQERTEEAERDMRRGTSQPSQSNPSNQTNQSSEPSQTGQGQTVQSTEILYAIVTCVVDRTRVRDVVVDMRNNSIVGMQSTGGAMSSSWNNELNRDLDRDVNRTNDRTTERNHDRNMDSNQQRAGLVRASDLMNASARNAQGDRLGDIDELAIDPESNRVVYGVLRRGGFLGIGESRYALPTSKLSVPRDGRVVLNMQEEDFKDRAGFDNNSWPTQADPQWSSPSVNDAARQRENATPRDPASTRDGTAARTTARVVKASDIIGSAVESSDGQKIGNVKDLVVEPSTGRVVYAVVSSERGEMPVPMAALKASGKKFTVPMTHTQIQTMPPINSDRDPNWDDAQWNRQLHESYGTRMEASASTSDRGDR